MQWAKLQSTFADAMLQGDDTKMVSHIDAGDIAVADRLDVYRTNILLTLQDGLAEQYQAVKMLVGEAFFAKMAQNYIVKFPPEHSNLNHCGDGFARFIEQYKPAESLPYLPDMARFEWAWMQSFYGQNDEALDVPSLQSQIEKQGDMWRATFRASVAFVASDYPVDALWRYCVLDKGEGEAPDLENDPVYLLLHRPKLKVEVIRLAAPIYRVLTALNAGLSLGAALSLTEVKSGFDITDLLSLFIEQPLLLQDHEGVLS